MAAARKADALIFDPEMPTYAVRGDCENPRCMTTAAEKPCSDFGENHSDFYQALLRDAQRAWECLYLRAYRTFVPYACQRSPISTDDALDLLQEGMAEFAVKLKNGKYAFQGSPVAAYVFTVCRNRWVSFLKRNRIQRVETTRGAADDEEETDEPTPAFLSRGDADSDEETDEETPGRDPIWEETDVDWEAVSRSFDQVGDDCRAMLHCFYVEEKSLGECGARIGLQENSAKVKRFRCAQRMKTLYGQFKTT
jgi:RNA polymerase sigma factor (sigma-70 family)